MTWNYWPLKFPDKATADGLLYDNGEPRYNNLDVIGLIPGATGWHVNIAVKGVIATFLSSYVIPFPMYPKRVFFTKNEGVI
jgi:hypothetical protein